MQKKAMLNEILADIQKPQFYNDPKIKAKIAIGTQIFERKYGQDQTKHGYAKLLNKIMESNLTVR